MQVWGCWKPRVPADLAVRDNSEISRILKDRVLSGLGSRCSFIEPYLHMARLKLHIKPIPISSSGSKRRQ